MKLSVIVPAFNEERYLPSTLGSIKAALGPIGPRAELIVVDNDSSDRTAEIARSFGARTISESVHNIGRVRNVGADAAVGDVLLFVDADTCIPAELPARIIELTDGLKCFGGAVLVDYTQFERRWVRFYASMWRVWGKVFNMKGGAAQFCRRDVFEAIGGYDETVFLGEDVEFYWALTKYARQDGGRLEFIEDMTVTTSSRRFDKMSLFKTLVLTHPFFIAAFRKKPGAWKDWYENAVR